MGKKHTIPPRNATAAFKEYQTCSPDFVQPAVDETVYKMVPVAHSSDRNRGSSSSSRRKNRSCSPPVAAGKRTANSGAEPETPVGGSPQSAAAPDLPSTPVREQPLAATAEPATPAGDLPLVPASAQGVPPPGDTSAHWTPRPAPEGAGWLPRFPHVPTLSEDMISVKAAKLLSLDSKQVLDSLTDRNGYLKDAIIHTKELELSKLAVDREREHAKKELEFSKLAVDREREQAKKELDRERERAQDAERQVKQMHDKDLEVLAAKLELEKANSKLMQERIQHLEAMNKLKNKIRSRKHATDTDDEDFEKKSARTARKQKPNVRERKKQKKQNSGSSSDDD